ncbi:MAG: hypothetical protein ACP5QS_03680 [bacterium]
MPMPMIEIAQYKISKLVCGTNSFLGFSHFSYARDTFLKRYFSVERIAEVMKICLEKGINAFVGPADPKLAEARKLVEDEVGQRMIWISTTYGHREKEKQAEEIKWLSQQKAEICLIHASYTDSHLISGENKIEGIEDLLSLIREGGMIPGLSTHRPDTLPSAEAAGYDVACYILPLNVIGFLCAVETNWQAEIIRRTPKPVIIIKPLAAGRVMPYEALYYVLANTKPNDPIAIGFMNKEEVEEDVSITEMILSGKGEMKLLYSPSKSLLEGEK